MKDILRMVVILGVICVVAGVTLAYVYEVTKDPIKLTELENVQGPAIKALLTEENRDNDPIAESFTLPAGKDKKGRDVEKSVFPAKKGGELKAVAIEGSGKGYGGTVSVMVGIDPQSGQLMGIAVTNANSETPGIGSRITESAFTGQFKGQPVESATAVDGVSGASFSTAGALGAVEEAVTFYQQNKDKILAEAGK